MKLNELRHCSRWNSFEKYRFGENKIRANSQKIFHKKFIFIL